MAGVARRAALLGASVRGIQPAGAGLRLLHPGNDLREDRLSAVSGLSDSAGLLPSGEHLSHVVRGTASCVSLPAQRPHRPQLLGTAFRQRTGAHRGGRRGGRLQHGPVERRLLICSVVPLGHLRLRDSRTVQWQGRGRCVRRRSPYSCLAFHWLRVFQGRGDWQCGPADLCRRDRFHADHLGGPWEPVLQA
ncbi:hypothetical protein D3C86_1563620 [compost metagenome]